MIHLNKGAVQGTSIFISIRAACNDDLPDNGIAQGTRSNALKVDAVPELNSLLSVALPIAMIIIPFGVMIWLFVLKQPDNLDPDNESFLLGPANLRLWDFRFLVCSGACFSTATMSGQFRAAARARPHNLASLVQFRRVLFETSG
jgi:hypothetical protein